MLYFSSDPRVRRIFFRGALGSFFVLASLFLFTASTIPANAQESEANPSAKIINPEFAITPGDAEFIQVVAIQNVLRRYNSPLVSYADDYVAAAKKYELSPYLLISISGLESFFGKFMVPGSYNGYGWGGGYIYFESWPDGIEIISKALRERYYGRGAKTLDDVGNIYAESPTWSVRVAFFMRQFEAEEERLKQLIALL